MMLGYIMFIDSIVSGCTTLCYVMLLTLPYCTPVTIVFTLVGLRQTLIFKVLLQYYNPF